MDKSFNSLVRRSRNSLQRANELMERGEWLTKSEIQHLYKCVLIVCGDLLQRTKSYRLNAEEAEDFQNHLIVLFFLETISQRKQIVSYLTLEVKKNTLISFNSLLEL
jgi:hypothetical protein